MYAKCPYSVLLYMHSVLIFYCFICKVSLFFTAFIKPVYLALRWDYLWLAISYYHHNAAVYGQNKHAHANLRRFLGLELASRVVWGLM